MGNLLAYGCSNTYGQGLPDCIPTKKTDPPPSKLGWVQRLGDHLQKKAINYGKQGASVKEVCWWLEDTWDEIQEDDTVIIFWPYFIRWGVITGPKENREWRKYTSGGADDDKETKLWYKYFHEDDDAIRTCRWLIDYWDRRLSERNIEHYHVFHTDEEKHYYRNNGVKNIVDVVQGFYWAQGGYELAPDGHLGVDGNIAFARDLYESIYEQWDKSLRQEWRGWFLDHIDFYNLECEQRNDRKYHYYNFYKDDVPFHNEFEPWLKQYIGKREFEVDTYHVHVWDEGAHFDNHTDNFKRRKFTYVCELEQSLCKNGLVVNGQSIGEGWFKTNVVHKVNKIKSGRRISLTVFGVGEPQLI